MLDQKGFDLWAEGYDRSVELSDEEARFPFAGYKALLNEIYNRVLAGPHRTVLDIGFGTAFLTSRLYQAGAQIFGQDFSAEMVRLAWEKMPEARLYQGDFARGLRAELKENRYDAAIATYSLHHLDDGQKVRFIRELLPLLNEGGRIYIGDVAFRTRAELAACREAEGEKWDPDEIYFVFEELKKDIPALTFEPFSYCAGLLTLPK